MSGANADRDDVDVIGRGADMLLLPALSSISTRQEMRPLAEHLTDHWRCVMPDWPAFGARPRSRAALSPDTMRRFLDSLLDTLRSPLVGVAAGHGAVYLLEAARRHPGRFERLVLIAPTWRGPLPTMFGNGHATLCRRVRGAFENPLAGPQLYRLSVSRTMVSRMMRAHVLADASRLTPDLLEAKLAVTRQTDARFATGAFITGALDPVGSRAAFLDLFEGALPDFNVGTGDPRVACLAVFQGARPPRRLLMPASAPPRSGAEMAALAATGRVTTVTLPGALAMHEENAAAVSTAIRTFLTD